MWSHLIEIICQVQIVDFSCGFLPSQKRYFCYSQRHWNKKFKRLIWFFFCKNIVASVHNKLVWHLCFAAQKFYDELTLSPDTNCKKTKCQLKNLKIQLDCLVFSYIHIIDRPYFKGFYYKRFNLNFEYKRYSVF